MQSKPIQINTPKGGEEINLDSNVDAPRKPQAVPREEKDFQRVLKEKKERRESKKDVKDEEGEGTDEGIEESYQKRADSIFDLSAKTQPREVHPDLASSYEGKEIKKEGKEPDTRIPETKTGKDTPLLREVKERQTERRTERQRIYAREQPDLSSVNPLSTPQGKIEGIASTKTETSSVIPGKTELQALITQLVDRVTSLKKEGQTDTTITLKHPPLFNGVEIKISSFESARGEFNVAFANLTAQAKDLLDLNMDTLRLGLERKGFLLHIATTSTQIEVPKETEGELFTREHRGGSQQEGQREGKEEKED